VKNIRRKPIDLKTLRLSPEEGFVLSRLDAPLSVKELVSLTGIDESRVVEIIEGLATQGALDVDREGPAARPAPKPQAKQSAQTAPVATTAAAEPEQIGPLDELEELGPGEELQELGPADEVHDEEQPAADAAATTETRAAEAGSEDSSDEQPAPASAAAEGAEGEDAEETEEEVAKRLAGDRELRKIYEELFAPLERDARIKEAEVAKNPELYALCLDPDPQVINAVLKNLKASLEHARLVAFHHHTHVGLDHVGRRSEFLADAHVQRRLLCNPQLPDALLRRIVNPKLLMDIYKIAINRENPEMTRVKTRELLQKKFMLAGPEERAALIVKTDGRCFVLLVNCALDARTTQILCGRTGYTVLFIQNCARWSACPPALLTHLLKQPLVRQSMGLRKMLLKHPNVPYETKRNLS
jgi:hypothetical protein